MLILVINSITFWHSFDNFVNFPSGMLLIKLQAKFFRKWLPCWNELLNRAPLRFGGGWALATFNFIILHRFSIGFRFGELDGKLQTIDLILIFPVFYTILTCVWDHYPSEGSNDLEISVWQKISVLPYIS
jgi:hypothetical protein